MTPSIINKHAAETVSKGLSQCQISHYFEVFYIVINFLNSFKCCSFYLS